MKEKQQKIFKNTKIGSLIMIHAFLMNIKYFSSKLKLFYKIGKQK